MSIPGVPSYHWESNSQSSPGVSPANQTVKVGTSATFTLDPNIHKGGAIQWYKRLPTGGGNIKIDGATTETYTTPPTTLADNFTAFVPYVNGTPAGGYEGLITVAFLTVYAEGEKIANWTKKTEHATWSDRDSMMYPLVYNNKLWIFEGWLGSSRMLADVWNTTDAINWQLILQTAPWGNIELKSLDMTMGCVFQGKMWKMGGSNAAYASNEVWSSTDGVNWQKHPNAPWIGRGAGAIQVFKNKIWVTGGKAFNGTLLNDIWSFDGQTWKSEGNAAWEPRLDHRTVEFRGRYYLIGGLTAIKLMNDVWVTDDGVNFTKLHNAPFKERHWFQLEVYRDRLFMVAGETYGPFSQLCDVWYYDGTAWKQLKSEVSFRQRHGFGLRVYNDELILLGGSDFRWGFPQVSNSVWSLSLPEDFFGTPAPTTTSTTTTSTTTTTKLPETTTTSTTTTTTLPEDNTPYANDISLITGENEAISVPLEASNSASEFLTLMLVSAPQHGSFKFELNKTIVGTYTPDEGFEGVDTFTWKLNNGEKDSNVAQVIIVVGGTDTTTTTSTTTTTTTTSTTSSTTTRVPSGEFRVIIPPEKFNLIGPGETVTVSAEFDGGTPPYKFQWRKNGYDIPGETSTTITLSSSGQYALNASDSANHHLYVGPVYVNNK